jgi:hypothetical protein
MTIDAAPNSAAGGLASAKLFVDAAADATPLVITAGALIARAVRGVTFGDALVVLTPGLICLQELVHALLRAVANNVVLPPRLLALLCGGDASIKCVTLYATLWSDGKSTHVDLCERGRAIVDRLAARNDLPVQLLHVGIHQAASAMQAFDAPRPYLPPCRLITGDFAWRSVDKDILFRCRQHNDANVVRYAYDIGSRDRSAADLHAWIDQLTADAQNDAVAAGVCASARYHFVYRGHAAPQPSARSAFLPPQGGKLWEPQFTKSVLAGNGVRCFDSLARVYHPQVARLRRDMALLDDDAHFARHGGRRKKGYLFSGPPGSGKTATVVAVAADTGRHILEVPWSRILTNADLEDLMSLRSIDGVSFHPRQLLVFFDEIDGGGDLFDASAKNAVAPPPPPPAVVVIAGGTSTTSTTPSAAAAASTRTAAADKLHVGAVLACLDGVANHDGLVIVAATNHPEKLPAAMKRSGRLTHIAFTYLRPEDAVAMARDYFAVSDCEALELAAAVGSELTGATMRELCEGSDDVRELIDAILRAESFD